MRMLPAASCGVAALLFASFGCNGSSGGADNPTGPSPGGPAVVTIVGERGAQSFNPNPASASQGRTIVWRNNDGVTHRIVMNDDSLDTGNIAPGGTSRELTLPAAGANYHCSIHPTMIGAINAVAGSPPPCTGPYC